MSDEPTVADNAYEYDFELTEPIDDTPKAYYPAYDTLRHDFSRGSFDPDGPVTAHVWIVVAPEKLAWASRISLGLFWKRVQPKDVRYYKRPAHELCFVYSVLLIFIIVVVRTAGT